MDKDKKHIHNLCVLLQDRPNGAGNARIAASIVIKNRVVGYGFNEEKSSPFQKRFSKNTSAIYLHAELSAITKAVRRIDEKKLQKATLYVARLKKDKPGGKNIFGCSCPCTGCAEAIKQLKIKRVVFTTDSGLIAEIVKCL
jgi:tRNA(Arg) A34 adenosine deaminase TadA